MVTRLQAASFVSIITLFSIMSPQTPVTAQTSATDVTLNSVVKGVVKINTFVEDEDYSLTRQSYGSGILLNANGLMLTNNHVIEAKESLDDSDRPAGYLACLPKNTTDEPDCSYTARLVANNKDLDDALLQIDNVPNAGTKNDYPFLKLNQVDTTAANDVVFALGYPEIGNGSITITSGIVSGKTEKYGKKWIKTDAVVSFGSSGGAAVDNYGNVIGLTSAGHADFLGSLGYITNITSINSWIDAHKNDAPQTSALAARALAYGVKELELKTAARYENDNPHFSINKAEDWIFHLYGENDVLLTNPGDADGGSIRIYLSRNYPYALDARNIIPHLKYAYLRNGGLSFFRIISDTAVTVGGKPAKKIIYVDSDGRSSSYIVPYGNHLIFIDYSYGKNDKDKAIVDSFISTFVFRGSMPQVVEQKDYVGVNPAVKLNLSGDWVLTRRNSKSYPLVMLNKKYKDLYVSIEMSKLDDVTRGFSNDELLNQYVESATNINKVSAAADITSAIIEKNAKATVNKNITNAIKITSSIKAASDKKVLANKLDYTKKINDDYAVDIVALTSNPSKKVFSLYQREVNAMLQKLSLTQ